MSQPQPQVSVDPNSTQLPANLQPAFNFVTEQLGIGILLIFYLIYEQVFRPALDKAMNTTANSIQRGRLLNDILSQIGLITGGDRVLLGLFHNGQISASGYHLTRMTITNSYCKPSVALNSTRGTVHIGIIINDLIKLMDAPGHANLIRRKEITNQSCAAYLDRNGINEMYNCLLVAGNLPVGIMSVQYIDRNKMELSQEDAEILTELVSELQAMLVSNLNGRNLFKLFMQKLGRKV